MNPVQRCLKAIRHASPDRVPVVPLIISHAAQLAGVPFWDYNRDPKVIVDCQVVAWRRDGYDGIHVTTDNWILPQALGIPVQFHPDTPPVGLACPLANTKDLSVLTPLREAKGAARMGLLPDATHYARDLLGDAIDHTRGAFVLFLPRARGIGELNFRSHRQRLAGSCSEF